MIYFRYIFLTLLATHLLSYPTVSQAMKEKRLYPMGEKIYQKLCAPIELSNYKSYEAMQEDIASKTGCKELSTKHFEALCLYLWDIKRNMKKKKVYKKLSVTKDEKCPVCGMFLYKYPTWVSRIVYTNKRYGFDGIKDLMKYYFDNKQNIVDILVQDYYTAKTLNAREAFFVLGSDVYGPMGNELLAFENKKSAERFMLDHRGKEILTFDAITPEKIYALDE